MSERSPENLERPNSSETGRKPNRDPQQTVKDLGRKAIEGATK